MIKMAAKKNNSSFPLDFNKWLLWLTNILMIPLLVILYLIGVNNLSLAYCVSFIIVADMFFLSYTREVDQYRREVESRSQKLVKHSQGLDRLAHQLRQPIVEAKSYARILAESQAVPVAQKEYALALIRELEQINLCTKEINDYLALERGHLSLRKTVVQADEIITEAVKLQELSAQAKGLKINLTKPDRLPMILADRVRLRETIEAIISNAIKASPVDSAIQVTARSDDDYLEVSVTDQGSGISAADKKRIFEPFSRIGGLEAAEGGLGLGLTLGREVIKNHGGQLGLASEPGQGSTFFFKIPLHLEIKK